MRGFLKIGSYMQRDQITGLDLTSDPDEADPTPGAKVVSLTSRRHRPEGDVDLADDEDPSDSAVLRVRRIRHRDTSRLSFMVRIWRAEVAFSFDVDSDRS